MREKGSRKKLWILLALALAALGVAALLYTFVGRRPPRIPVPMGPVAAEDLAFFEDDLPTESLLAAVTQSKKYYGRVPPDRAFEFGEDTFTAERLLKTLEAFEAFLKTSPSPDALDAFVRENFRIYRASGQKGMGRMLFTGYYEPEIEASLVPKPGYDCPLYQVPDDLVTIDLSAFSSRYSGQKIVARIDGKKVIPYHGRKAIDGKGALAGKGLEVAWARDPVDVFFLHIQGSGRLVLPDGQSVHILYAGKNGRPYRSIGGLLIREGAIPREEMSMQAIRQWLTQNPGDAERIFFHNPSYVFFTLADKGPLGCLGLPITPGRSVATDTRVFPRGALGFVRCQKPETDPATGKVSAWKPFSRFVLNQDTGGAIRGPGRLDLFCGFGDYAETFAGHLKHEGELYFLVLKDKAAGKT